MSPDPVFSWVWMFPVIAPRSRTSGWRINFPGHEKENSLKEKTLGQEEVFFSPVMWDRRIDLICLGLALIRTFWSVLNINHRWLILIKVFWKISHLTWMVLFSKSCHCPCLTLLISHGFTVVTIMIAMLSKAVTCRIPAGHMMTELSQWQLGRLIKEDSKMLQVELEVSVTFQCRFFCFVLFLFTV